MWNTAPTAELLWEASEDTDCVSVMGNSSIAPVTVAGIVTAGDQKKEKKITP